MTYNDAEGYDDGYRDGVVAGIRQERERVINELNAITALLYDRKFKSKPAQALLNSVAYRLGILSGDLRKRRDTGT